MSSRLTWRREREKHRREDWTEIRHAALDLTSTVDLLMRIMTTSIDSGELDRMEASGAMSDTIFFKDEIFLLTTSKQVRRLVQELANRTIEVYANFMLWHFDREQPSPPGWDDSFDCMSEARSNLATRLRESWESPGEEE